MVIVLDEIALREAVSEILTSRHVDDGDAEESGCGLDAFNPHGRKGRFVDRGWIEGMSLIRLDRVLVKLIGFDKSCARIRRVGRQGGAEDRAVEPIFAEVLIDADEVLESVAVIGIGIISRVCQICAAGKIKGG